MHRWLLILLVALTTIAVSVTLYMVEPEVGSWPCAYNLNTGKGFYSIQEALDDFETKPGHTIALANGVYTENLLINKEGLTLASYTGRPEDVVIEAKNPSKPVIMVRVNGVTIKGLTITGAEGLIIMGTRMGPPSEGVKLARVSSITIQDNVLKRNGFGVRLQASESAVIYGNDITGNLYGIQAESSEDLSIRDNDLSNNVFAIRVTSSTNSKIQSNNINRNIYAIHLMSSSHSLVQDNSIVNSWDGIWLSSSSKALIQNNFKTIS